MNILCLIPARGNSKAIFRKNLIRLGHKTLIEHAWECVSRSTRITRSIISSDSKEILNHAAEIGFEIPFQRPENLAKDDTPDWPVFDHALCWLKQHDNYVPDLLVHLRLTSPFAYKREAASGGCNTIAWKLISRWKIIDQMIDMLVEHENWDSIRALETPHATPYKMWIKKDDLIYPLLSENNEELYNMPRQKLPPVYKQSGYADVVRLSTLLEQKSMTGKKIGSFYIDCDYCADIDTPAEYDIAQLIYQKTNQNEITVPL